MSLLDRLNLLLLGEHAAAPETQTQAPVRMFVSTTIMDREDLAEVEMGLLEPGALVTEWVGE